MRSFLLLLLLFGYNFLTAQNKFTDPVMQKIYTLQDERKIKELLTYLKDANEKYREAAALAFGSVQEEIAIDPLIGLLSDKSEKVRMAAAYSLGQAKDSTAVKDLQTAYKKETSFNVKGALLEAMGKCGTAKTLAFIVEQSYYPENTAMNNGIARALFHLANKKIVSAAGTAKAIELIGKPYASIVRQNASAYLARARGIDLNPHMRNIERSLSDPEVNVRMNIARSLGKLSSSSALEFAQTMLKDKDYRVSVNAISALRTFEPEIVRGFYIVAFENTTNPHVALTAAEGLLRAGTAGNAGKYYSHALSSTDFRVRSVLYAAALKYVEPNGRDTMFRAITKLYSTLTDPYKKGMLLTALSEYPPAAKFIAEQTFTGEQPVTSTYGIEALSSIRRSPGFGRTDTSLFTLFDNYFLTAIQKGDVALVAVAAGVMQDTSVVAYPGWRKGPKIRSDVKAMEKALSKLTMPRDVETYMALRDLIAFYNGKEVELPKAENMHPINWEFVASLPATSFVKVATTKGDFVLQLFINDAPGSVGNFLELVKRGYYNGKVFHRVVPNFVIQTGCPRGDGWGNTDYTIRSEFAPLNYDTGYLGMASAGKDTEGPQWFVTHSPTPHLDGNYTIFGKVTEGMEVIHQIGVGDKILSVIYQ